jgi:DNA-binding NtrC family response regulator
LIVEDEPGLASLWTRCAVGWGYAVRSAETVRKAIELLSWQPDLILLDVHLPDGSGLEVAESARRIRPTPAIVATTGAASKTETFSLGSLGVRGFIEKPFTPRELREALLRAFEAPRDPMQPIGACVGHVSLPELQRALRREVLEEALARTGGNLTETARLLGVSRQVLQYLRRSL